MSSLIIKRTFSDKYIMENFRNQGGDICYFCGNKIEGKITVDHKNPLSRGGKTEYKNLCNCCNSCNNEKDDMTEEEYRIYRDLSGKEKVEYKRLIDRKIHSEKYMDMKYNDFTISVPRNTHMIIPLNKIKIEPEYKDIELNSLGLITMKQYFDKFFEFQDILYVLPDYTLVDGYEFYVMAKQLGINIAPIHFCRNKTFKMKQGDVKVTVPVGTERLVPLEHLTLPDYIGEKNLTSFKSLKSQTFYEYFGNVGKPIYVTEEYKILDGVNSYYTLLNSGEELAPIKIVKTK